MNKFKSHHYIMYRTAVIARIYHLNNKNSILIKSELFKKIVKATINFTKNRKIRNE